MNKTILEGCAACGCYISKGGNYGECRRYPPQMVYCGWFFGVETHYPKVLEKWQRCSMFQKREANPTPAKGDETR